MISYDIILQISGAIWPTRFARYTRLFYTFSKKIFKLFKFVVVHDYILFVFCIYLTHELIDYFLDKFPAEVVIISAGLKALKYILVIGENLLKLGIQPVLLDLVEQQHNFLNSQSAVVENVDITVSRLEHFDDVINNFLVVVVHDRNTRTESRTRDFCLEGSGFTVKLLEQIRRR